MKITNLNLLAFDDWEQRQPNILAYLQQEDPDIILFQEAVYLPDVSPFNQVELLNRTLGYASMVCDITREQVGLKYPVYREGLACLSKFPISSNTIALKKDPTDEHNRILQLLDILVDGEIIKLGNIHFSITDTTDFATPQLVQTLDILTRRKEQRILIGDYNLAHLEDTAHLWEEQYNSTIGTPYISYPGPSPGYPDGKRVDYALVPKAYTITDVSVSPDGLSDHRALTIEISKPSRKI